MQEDAEGVNAHSARNLCLSWSDGKPWPHNHIRKPVAAAIIANYFVLLSLAVCIGIVTFDQMCIDRACLVENPAPAKTSICVDGKRTGVDEALDRSIGQYGVKQVARRHRGVEKAAREALIDAGRKVVNDHSSFRSF